MDEYVIIESIYFSLTGFSYVERFRSVEEPYLNLILQVNIPKLREVLKVAQLVTDRAWNLDFSHTSVFFTLSFLPL